MAGEVREAQRQELLALSLEERAELSLALGRRDVEFYMAVHHVDRATAKSRLRALVPDDRRHLKTGGEL